MGTGLGAPCLFGLLFFNEFNIANATHVCVGTKLFSYRNHAALREEEEIDASVLISMGTGVGLIHGTNQNLQNRP